MKKNILLSCPFPLTFRNFINTGLASELEDQLSYKVSIISPYRDKYFQDENLNRFDNFVVAYDKLDKGIPLLSEVTFIDSIFKSIHLTGFAIEYPDASLQNIELSKRFGISWLIAKIITVLAPRKSVFRKWLRIVYSKYRPVKKSVQNAFDEIEPSVVIVASPGHYWLDHFVIDEAKRRHIPVFCIILSWDNLYSRGPLCRRPDYLLVWSEEMKNQAINIHSYPVDKISIVGALQFKFYNSIPTIDEINTVKKNLGIVLDCEYIAYVCGARTSLYDVEDVIIMKSILDKSQFKNCKIVVRPHPQGEKENYKILANHGIIVDEALDILMSSPDTFNISSMKYMAAFLSGARFVVSSWGTTALLEACIFQRPSIQLRWMDEVYHADPKEVEMVKKFQRYLHMKAFDNEGARLYCDSPDQLVGVMQRLENEQFEFKQKRKNVVNKIVFTPLNEVVNRVISIVQKNI
jgi:hypothetical protein